MACDLGIQNEIPAVCNVWKLVNFDGVCTLILIETIHNKRLETFWF